MLKRTYQKIFYREHQNKVKNRKELDFTNGHTADLELVVIFLEPNNKIAFKICTISFVENGKWIKKKWKTWLLMEAKDDKELNFNFLNVFHKTTEIIFLKEKRKQKLKKIWKFNCKNEYIIIYSSLQWIPSR